MNTYRKLLRIWIALASFVGFFTGWAFLAKTEKTETVIQTETGNIVIEMPAIPELPSIDGLSSENSGSVQTFTINPVTNTQSFTPQLRTGGS